ncbi:MAG: hypothetical protein R3C61_20230 [Bacteroidia bacterium]
MEIDISQPSVAFKKHLALEGNNRIFFSGIFGIGKSYFLKNFFEERANEYLFVRLSPVNYSIANNIDIFDLVRYDILNQLIGEDDFEIKMIDPDFNEGHFNKAFLALRMKNLLESMLIFTAETPGGEQNLLIGAANFAGKIVPKLLEGIEKLAQKYSDEKDRIKNTEEKLALENLIRRMNLSNMYNHNIIDWAIQTGMDKMVGKRSENPQNPPVEKVLIIDDMDRLDPEHIFRLFNVFSVHFPDEGQNRFGFDKVIFVGDIYNIRSIFHARYGQNSDFSGYIDKFYAHQIFYFNNTEAINDIVEQILVSLPVDNEITGYSKKIWAKITAPILSSMVIAGAVNLRSLRKYAKIKETIHFHSNKITFKSPQRKYETDQFWSIQTLRLLANMFGDSIILKQAVKKTELFFANEGTSSIRIKNQDAIDCFEEYWGEFAFISDPKVERSKSPVPFHFESNQKNISFNYVIDFQPSSPNLIYLIKLQKGSFPDRLPELISYSDFFRLMDLALDYLIPLGVFKQ